MRQLEREIRRAEVLKLVKRYGLLNWGVQPQIAKKLKVHRCTVSRDIKGLLWVLTHFR